MYFQPCSSLSKCLRTLFFFRYFVTHLMGADLNNIIKCQKLTDDHVQFITYQILRGLKVGGALKAHHRAEPADPSCQPERDLVNN